jgi:hypothetical protein
VTKYEILPSDVESDIRLYSKGVIDAKLPRKSPTFRDELASKLAEKWEGMFLWIKLQQDQLRGGKGQKELQRIVRNMPTGLDHSYEKYWKSIQSGPDHERYRAISIHRWTTFALRPLTVTELTDAILIDPTDHSSNFCVDDLPDSIDDDYIDQEIKALCGCLIEVRSLVPNQAPGERTVHLVHSSVRDYLRSTIPDSSGMGVDAGLQNLELAKLCRRYINFREAWVWESSDQEESPRPFQKYAAESWFLHLDAAVHQDQAFVDIANAFFQPDNPNFNSWRKYYESMEPLDSKAVERVPSTVIYYAALFNFVPTMMFLKTQGGLNLDFDKGRYGAALQAVCSKANNEAFNVLMQWGVSINSSGGKYGAPINAAAAGGNVNMVKCLLQQKASLRALRSNAANATIPGL